MSKYRVSKIKNNDYDPIETHPFDDLPAAVSYAKQVSAGDEEHFYVVEQHDQDFDDYDDIEYYVNGEANSQF